jgi:hypothetical protein
MLDQGYSLEQANIAVANMQQQEMQQQQGNNNNSNGRPSRHAQKPSSGGLTSSSFDSVLTDDRDQERFQEPPPASPVGSSTGYTDYDGGGDGRDERDGQAQQYMANDMYDRSQFESADAHMLYLMTQQGLSKRQAENVVNGRY